MNDDLHAVGAAASGLGQMNPRRFEVLLSCIRLGGEFTSTDLRAALRTSEPSLPRDLNALEATGLLDADPPASNARQGQRVRYTVAPRTREVFAALADEIEKAYLDANLP